MKNILIVGAGGVGGYFGGKLAAAGHDVTFLARGNHLKAIQNYGLKVKSIYGDFYVSNVKATDDLTTVGKADIILICVKAWQVKEVARDLKTIIKEDTLVLPLQNGVLATRELSDMLDPKHILTGLCRIISMIEAPGLINHIGVNPTIIFGEQNNDKSDRVMEVCKIFNDADINAKVAEDIQSELWKKFIAICASGFLAVCRSTYGEVLEMPDTRKMLEDLLYEVYAVSQEEGVHISSDFVRKTMSFFDSFPYDATSSLTRDVWEGKPSEIEYQNGTVVSLGVKHGIETPVNKFVYSCILPGEKKARAEKNRQDFRLSRFPS